jgi:hypothetical protein
MLNHSIHIKMKPRNCFLFALIWIALSSQAQKSEVDLFRMARQGEMTLQNREVTAITETDRKFVRLSARDDDGVAWLNGVTFSNGIIELDIRGKDVIQKSFVGIAFHGLSRDSLEAVYFRPFNFRTDDSVRKIHAVEYIFHPDFPWEKLRKEYPGKYEKGIVPPPVPDQWFHAKIVVQYPEINVYVNGRMTPCLTVQELSNRRDGKIGLWVGKFSDGDFANLTILKQ